MGDSNPTDDLWRADVAEAMRAQGVSGRDLARTLGIPSTTMAGVLSGPQRVSLQVAVKVAIELDLGDWIPQGVVWAEEPDSE
jgi:lambda repressor-like predicted transcriptional regulator